MDEKHERNNFFYFGITPGSAQENIRGAGTKSGSWLQFHASMGFVLSIQLQDHF